MNTEHLGQVFTPQSIVADMLQLRKNYGAILEPSAGGGAFWQHICYEDGAVGIEIDRQHCPAGCLNIDFFEYPIANKFDTIIGNPPYVAGKNIQPETRSILAKKFPFKTNLYIHFIAKCLAHLNDGGELIFITPRDFIKHTFAIPINNMLYGDGSITYWFEYGEDNLFKGTPTAHNLVVWRFEKGYNGPKKTIVNGTPKKLVNTRGQLMFVSGEYSVPFSQLFYVKVGAVSGADDIFVNERGNLDIVCSTTVKTGQTRRVYYDHYDEYLLNHKDELIKRRIKKFNESNWYKWGRRLCTNDAGRIYVNCKTRCDKPFFIHQCKNFDGSVLGIFPIIQMNLQKACDVLNDTDWSDLGFKYGGRLIFNQRSLESTLLPSDFLQRCDGHSH
jgi:adenine-specific DNA-methyltransferase